MYSKVNIYVGKYRNKGIFKRDVEDWIGLPDAEVRIMRGVETDQGWVQNPLGDPWLIVQHGEFWPVMIHLDEDDIAELGSLQGVFTAV